MIYLRLQGKMGQVFNQIAYAEDLSKLYNQEIALYTNGSQDNEKEYYDNILKPCGILSNYNFTEEYPMTETILAEKMDNFEELLAERGNSGQDLIIDGDFFWRKDSIGYDNFKTKFSPSQSLLNFMSNYGITENSLYIDAEPYLTDNKNEYAAFASLLRKQMEHFNKKSFDKVFVRTSWVDIFNKMGVENIIDANEVIYINVNEIPEVYRDATQIMFPYLCKYNIISNYIGSWWGHVLNKQVGQEVGILFPYGAIKRVPNAADGITAELVCEAITDVVVFSTEERDKQRSGQPSAFDYITIKDLNDKIKEMIAKSEL